MHGRVATSAICQGGPRVLFEIYEDEFGASNEYARLFDEGMGCVDGPAVDRGAIVAAEIYGPPMTVAAFKCGVMARDQWIVGQCNKIVCLSSDGYVRSDQFDRPDTTTGGINLYPRHTASLTPRGHRDQV